MNVPNVSFLTPQQRREEIQEALLQLELLELHSIQDTPNERDEIEKTCEECRKELLRLLNY